MSTIDLTDTNANAVSSALVAARRAAGSQAVGMVLTLVVVVDEATHYDALKVALDAGREHPSRVLVVITRPGGTAARLDAEIRVAESRPGDTIVLRLYGELAKHADSVVLPLLLPDTPVVVWWPSKAPAVPGDDQLGGLAQRRITDAAAVAQPVRALHQRAVSYQPGDTDLAWTRLTPWRALLASALDQLPSAQVIGATVEAEAGNPSAEVLASWLDGCLGVDVTRRVRRDRVSRSSSSPPRTARSSCPDRTAFSPTSSCPEGRTARSPCAVARPPSCSPRSFVGSTRTTCTPR